MANLLFTGTGFKVLLYLLVNYTCSLFVTGQEFTCLVIDSEQAGPYLSEGEEYLFSGPQ